MIDSILPFALANLALGYGMAYTPPSSSQRPLLVFLIITCCLVSVRSTISNLVPGQVGNEYVIGFMLHASHFLCLAQLHPPPHSTPSIRRSWAINQVFNGRWGIVYIPPFNKKDYAYIPSRLELFLYRLWDLLWTAGLIYILQTYRLNVDDDDFFEVPNGFIHRLSDVTLREFVVRFYMFILGYTIPYCSLRAAHSLLSCLAIACGDTPHRWPPLFGSLGQAYTVRRWYSVFWHHLMRKAFTSHAILLVNGLLRLPRKSQVTRYLIIVATFMMSALLHILANPGAEQCSAYPQARYYLSVICAIALEDLVISTYQSWTGSSAEPPPQTATYVKEVSDSEKSPGIPNGKKVFTAQNTFNSGAAPGKLWKLVGFAWVLLFEGWATSKLMYGLYAC
ncbi:hypothetical protein MMC18_001513 [Xylographa bjoerkii]|nr:hypothetical protein [Xylographa bjoerkii]